MLLLYLTDTLQNIQRAARNLCVCLLVSMSVRDFLPKNSAFVDIKFVQATSIIEIETTFSTLRVGLKSLEEGKLEQ